MHINAHNHIVTLLIRILITHQLVGKHTSSSHHSSATEYSMIIRYNCRMVIPYVARYRLSIIPTAERPLIFGGIRSSFSCSSQRIHSEQIIRDLFLSSNTLSTYGWGKGGDEQGSRARAALSHIGAPDITVLATPSEPRT